MQISIIIPAKNEAASIGAVVGKIPSDFPKAEVIVVERMDLLLRQGSRD